MKSIFQNPFYKFIIIAISCYVVWYTVYDLWLLQNGRLDNFLSGSTTYIAVKILQLLGYQASYQEAFRLFFFYNKGVRLLQMVPACNGQVLYPLYVGFIIATPGLLKDKLKFILGGCVVIYFINVTRVVLLCLVKIHIPSYLAFNHKYTFTVFVYACIFAMWLIWIHYFVPKARKNHVA